MSALRRRGLLAAWVIGAAGTGQAQTAWPVRPVLVVNPYPAGAGLDPVARLVAQRLQQRLGQPFVVENRTGASGMVGAASVVRAAPDGHTFLFSTAGEITINPHLFPQMPYDPLADLLPVTEAVSLPYLLVAHPSVGVGSLAELLAKARAQPDRLTYASAGNGSLQHLAAEMLRSAAGGLRMIHVPYRGVAPALNDLIAGHVAILFAGFPAAIEHVRAGRLAALGVTAAARIASAPGIPTIAEQELPAFEVSQWFGIFLPAGTPDALVRRLHEEIAAVLALPDVRESLLAQGATPVASTPEEFARFVRAEHAKFGRIVHESGATADQ